MSLSRVCKGMRRLGMASTKDKISQAKYERQAASAVLSPAEAEVYPWLTLSGIAYCWPDAAAFLAFIDLCS